MNVLSNLSTSTNNVAGYLRNNSPKLLSLGSIIFEVGAVVTTGMATWKSKDIIEEHNVEIQCMHEKRDKAKDEEEKEKINKDIVNQYKDTALSIAGNFAVPAISLTASIACNRIATSKYESKISELNKQVAIGAAAYALLKKAYDDSKKRAEEKYGEEAAADIFYGSTEKEVEVVDKKGKKKVEKVKEYDPYGIVTSNPCAILLGEGINSNLRDNRWYDINFIKSLENKYTYKLNAEGYVYVWDIFTDLGVKPGSQFQHDTWASWGWIFDEAKIDNFKEKCRKEGIEWTDEDITNCNRIDLGLENFINGRYISGDEPTVWIIPNCLGDITPFVYPDGQKRKYDELMTP